MIGLKIPVDNFHLLLYKDLMQIIFDNLLFGDNSIIVKNSSSEYFKIKGKHIKEFHYFSINFTMY